MNNYQNQYEQQLSHFEKLLKELNLKKDQIPTSIVFGNDLKIDDLWHTQKRIKSLEFLILKEKQNEKK